MRNSIIILFSVFLFCLYACEKYTLTPQEKIIGNWVGIEYPAIDTVFFYSDNTAVIKGRAESSNSLNYSINEETILFTSQSGVITSHQYKFSGKNIYIGNLLIVIGMQDGGIEFSKN